MMGSSEQLRHLLAVGMNQIINVILGKNGRIRRCLPFAFAIRHTFQQTALRIS
jgi:hypothetical protein